MAGAPETYIYTCRDALDIGLLRSLGWKDTCTHVGMLLALDS